jgi:hypothetical protein
MPISQRKLERINESSLERAFNGKDLSGWKHVGPGAMVVEDGMLHGEGGMGLLYREGEKYGNCVFHIEWKMQKENSNSGFLFVFLSNLWRK